MLYQFFNHFTDLPDNNVFLYIVNESKFFSPSFHLFLEYERIALELSLLRDKFILETPSALANLSNSYRSKDPIPLL
jgi:hypothetical protein